MKRLLAILLTALMVLSMLALAACQNNTTKAPDDNTKTTAPADKTSGKPTEQPQTTDEVKGDDDGSTSDDVFSTLKLAPVTTGEHKKADSIPSSFTLVGTDTLPAIDNIGDIKCQAASAVTYMQFTNAVARYVKNKNPDDTWTPSTNFASCFSPKSTFFGGTYPPPFAVLQDMGALTNQEDGFSKNSTGTSILKRDGKYIPQSVAWQISEGTGEKAMNYRLAHYESVNTGEVCKEGDLIKFTNSDKGKEFMNRIKDALVTGNVVVLQGYFGDWVTQKLTSSSGDLGVSGDTAVVYATAHKNDLGQVSIVGYDDNIEVECAGATLQGAFLIANCKGTSWGTNGYMWMMYDAFNTKSAYEEFDLGKDENDKDNPRAIVGDVFYFVYWDTDIVEGKPELYAEVEMDVSNRTALKLEALRTDALNRTSSVATCYSESKADYGLEGTTYFNPAGVENGEAVTGFYTVSFARLLSALPEGSTYENFTWGIKVTSTKEDYPVNVRSIKLKNAAGEVITKLDLGDGDTFAKDSYTYVFDFGKEKSKNIIAGTYKLQNAATGKYVGKDGLMFIGPKDDAKDAAEYVFKYDSKTETNLIYRDDEKYVLDAKSGFATGNPLQFNAVSTGANATQAFRISFNDDNTFCFFLKSDKGTNYALAEVDGAIVMVKATELTDNMKWKMERVVASDATIMPLIINKSDAGLSIIGTTTGKKITDLALKVYNVADGSEVLTGTAKASNKLYTTELALKDPGTYLIRVCNTADNDAYNSGCAVVIIP